MSRSVRAAIPLLSFLVSPAHAQRASAEFASLLQPGMQLVYASEGVESPPWTIDSVTRELTFGARTGCVRIRLRTSPTQATPETRSHCVDSSTMYNWDDRSSTLRPARPVRPGASLDIQQASGGRNRFETGATSVERIRLEQLSTRETVAPIAVEVIATSVTTTDSSGKVVRRLRERFSIALATATGGVFEVPDSTQAGGWRTVRAFDLVAIRRREP